MVLAPLQFSGRGLTPDVLGGIQQGQQVLQGENILEKQRQGIEATRRKQGQQQQASQLIRRQQAGEQIQTGAELAQLMVDNPQLAENVLKASGISTEFQKNDLAQFGFQLEQASPEQQQQLIQQRIQAVLARGGNPQDTAALVGADPQKVGQFARTVQLAALSNEERLKIAQGGKQGLASAKTLLNADGSSIQALPNQQVLVRNRLGEVVTGQERLDVLRQAAEAQIEQKRREAGVEVEKAGDIAEVKADVDLRFKPAIRAAIKLAEKEASARGETLTTLKRAEAALPGLIATIDTLKELAPIATSTIGGKVFDFAVKESGFGATKGATARAKFIAIVANQVLPLLKETFGAAFTVGEGQELKATMGDPDASPEQKIAQLEAFIAQKKRSIETSQRELSLGTITVDDLSGLTDEQLAELARSAQ
jgi:hypothetical protein